MVTRAEALRGLRAGVTGAMLAGGFWGVSAAESGVPFWLPGLSCDKTRDRYCVGTAFLDLLLGVMLGVLIMVALAVLIGWGLLTLLRVRRALLVASIGPLILFGLALLGGWVGLTVFSPSIALLVAASVAYALAALLCRPGTAT